MHKTINPKYLGLAIIGIIVLLLMSEIIDILFFCNRYLPFWEAAGVISTASAVIVALSIPYIEKSQKRKDDRDNIVSSLTAELLVNFDQLHFASLTGSSYNLQREAFENLTNSLFHVNLGAIDGSYRELVRTYSAIDSVVDLAKSCDDARKHTLQQEAIIAMLQILQFAGCFDGSFNEFKSALDKFWGSLNRQERFEHSFQFLTDYFTERESFWKVSTFRCKLNGNEGELTWNSLIIHATRKFDKLQKMEVMLLVEEYLFHLLVAVFNKKPVKNKLKRKVEKLIGD